MQIKVKDTRMHRILLQPPHPRNNGFNTEEVPVVEAELVLVEEKYLTIPSIKVDDRIVKPILISRTEKIEVGVDWAYSLSTKELGKTWKGIINFHHKNFVKVLALPEHFSPKHLQAIVDGKMKEGDKVLVECDGEPSYSGCESYQCNHPLDPVEYTCDNKKCGNGCSKEKFVEFIKLNSSNHITLHKIEEKMYTREEVRSLILTVAAFPKPMNREAFDKWFEQNVK